MDAGCPYEAAAQAMKVIGGRWKILILRRLMEDGETGFNALQRALDGVSAKMLSQQLNELMADGIIDRDEIVSDPPKIVRYRLTALGQETAPILNALTQWGHLWLSRGAPGLGDAHVRDPANAGRDPQPIPSD